MIRFVTKAVHTCSFCGHETEGFDNIVYYTIDVWRKCADAIAKRGTEKHIVEKTMCGECYNKLCLYLVDGLTNREGR